MITEHVEYSEVSKILVDEYSALSLSDKKKVNWSDECYTVVRKEIKDHYKAVQKNQCPYCRQYFESNHNRLWDGEHILSKSKFPEYLFEPKNLCVSCIECNQDKSDKKVTVSDVYKSFPDKSNNYLIVHPHFDLYRDHIQVKVSGNIRFYKPVGGSKKGKNTIEMFRLYRFIIRAAADAFDDECSNVNDSCEVLDLVDAAINSDSMPSRLINLYKARSKIDQEISELENAMVS